MFDLQPSLEGERVRIRPLRADDFDALYAVARDPLLWAQHPMHTRHEEPVFRKLFADSLDSGGALVVIDKARDAIIGSSRFRIDPASGRVEIGWSWLARAYWGGSWNREVKTLLLGHAFRFVDAVMFRVGANNLRSRRAMEKIGGRLTDAVEMVPGADGVAIAHVIFEITKNEFSGRPALERQLET